MRGDFYRSAEMADESERSTDVVWMMVREDNIAHMTTFRRKAANTCGERRLLFLVGRGRVDND